MERRTRWMVCGLIVALSGWWAGCLRSEPGPEEVDPVAEELRALDAVASEVEASATQEDGGALVPLGEALEARLTQEDISVLGRNYLALLEAQSYNQPWRPDEDFYRVVDGLRDLPLLEGMPERAGEGEVKDKDKAAALGEGLEEQRSALALSNVSPRCGLPCDAQALLLAMVDLTLGQIERYYVDLLTSGVDCVQDAVRIWGCSKDSSCTWGQVTLFAAGCAGFAGGVALEASGLKKAQGAYALAKLVLGLWSSGVLGVQAQGWANDCREFQRTGCGLPLCPIEQEVCLAVNGSEAACCSNEASCLGCALCSEPCEGGCCALGQRCEPGGCVPCARTCGAGCCIEGEYCADAATSTCAPCENPCGEQCCAPGLTCIEDTEECCEVACNGQCCDDGEVCLSGRCCDDPCGATCCGDGETCNPATNRCERPSGCDDGPTLDCAELCQEAIDEALRRCVAMGGVLEDVNFGACVASCQCVLDAVPNLGACGINPDCPGCDELEEVIGLCGQTQATCRIEQ